MENGNSVVIDERAAGVFLGADPYRELELYLEKVKVRHFFFCIRNIFYYIAMRFKLSLVRRMQRLLSYIIEY